MFSIFTFLIKLLTKKVFFGKIDNKFKVGGIFMKKKRLIKNSLSLLISLLFIINIFNIPIHANVSPLVSVVVPVYNSASYLPRCLDSISNQTLKNIEIICVNDGSTDNSLSILNQYAEKDSRFKIFSQENQGCWSARNLGLKNATGEYISFVDSDDYIENNTYEIAYNTAHEHDDDILFFGIYWGGHRVAYNNTLIDINKKQEFRHFFQCFTVCDMLIKNDIIKQNNIEFKNMVLMEDLCFEFMIFPHAKRVESIKDMFYHYDRSNPESVTHKPKNIEYSFDMIKLMCKIVERCNIYYYYWFKYG